MKKLTALILTLFILFSSGCAATKYEGNVANDFKQIASETVTTEEITTSATTVETTVPTTQPTTKATVTTAPPTTAPTTQATTKAPETTAPVETQKPTKKPVQNKGEKLLAITFDDGPCSNTDEIAEIFNKHNAKATFFIVGNRIEGNEQRLKNLIDAGHEIGSHSWDHSELSNLKESSIAWQMNKTKKELYKATGYTTHLLRPPYGAYNSTVKKIAKENSFSLINWNVDTLDWQSQNSGKVYSSIINNANDGSIILCHDLYGSTTDAIEKAVPRLIKQGYKLVTVSELIEANGGTLQAGNVYFSKYEVR